MTTTFSKTFETAGGFLVTKTATALTPLLDGITGTITTKDENGVTKELGLYYPTERFKEDVDYLLDGIRGTMELIARIDENATEQNGDYSLRNRRFYFMQLKSQQTWLDECFKNYETRMTEGIDGE